MGIVNITPSSEKMACQAGEKINFQFSVSNVSGGELRVGLDVRSDGGDIQWLSVDGATERDLTEGVSTTINVSMAPPADLLAADSEDKEYTFRLRVYDAQNTETVEDSPTVSVIVKPAQAEEKMCLWCWLLPLIIVVVILLGVVLWFLLKSDKVDDFVGKNYENIETELLEKGYDITLSPVVSDHTPGIILEQQPEAGSDFPKLEGGEKVKLDLTLSAVTVQMPKLVGQTLAAAESLLQSADLVLGQVTEDENATSGSLVIGQTPSAEIRVLPQSKVDLVIPAQQKAVPSVVGFKYSEAQKALQEVGFRVRKDLVATGQGEPGVIISQNPLPSVKKKIGSTIVVKVEKKRVKVPSLVGQTPDQAIRLLKSQGFKIAKSIQGSSVSKNSIKVVSQSPAKNQEVPLGATVTITYPRYGFTIDPNVMLHLPVANVVASGKTSIKQTWSADLDVNNAPSNGKVDIFFRAKTSTERFVQSRNNASIAYMGTTAPSLSKCKSANLSTKLIDIRSLKVGGYLCVKTSSGNYSQVRITALPAPNVGQLGIQFTTWKP